MYDMILVHSNSYMMLGFLHDYYKAKWKSAIQNFKEFPIRTTWTRWNGGKMSQGGKKHVVQVKWCWCHWLWDFDHRSGLMHILTLAFRPSAEWWGGIWVEPGVRQEFNCQDRGCIFVVPLQLWSIQASEVISVEHFLCRSSVTWN